MIEKYIYRLKAVGEYQIAEYLQELHDEHQAALEDLHGLCHVCRYNNTKVCDSCTHTPRIFEEYGNADNWEWRGTQSGEQYQ